ncbi:MAG: response regulator [Sedimentisphaerales bacterium]|nr:response regulator [Sedimentisphaerales bacterium]
MDATACEPPKNQTLNKSPVSSGKSQLISSVGHKMRTPMNAIIGFSEVLAEGELSEEQKQHVEIIRESAEGLLELINDLLDYSMLEENSLEVEISACSLERLFAVVESSMRSRAKAKDLEFGFLQCSSLPAEIRTDGARVRQCLGYLIDNAIRFTEAGHVYVNVSCEDVEGVSCIRFDVEDTGIGLTSEKCKVIFESKVHSESCGRPGCSGSGLGLLITKELVNLLSGEVTVESKSGKGSVFSLRIPTNVDVSSQPPLAGYEVRGVSDRRMRSFEQGKTSDLRSGTDRRMANSEDGKASNLRSGADRRVMNSENEGKIPDLSGAVLVAEDSKSNQLLVRILLEQLGLEVTIAEDGVEAVTLASEQAFDLILMDMQMPNMNGYDATKVLRERGVTAGIVALTANAMKGDAEKCLACGCSDYITKPIDRVVLLEVLSRYLSDSHRILSQDIDSVGGEIAAMTQICIEGSEQGDGGQAVIEWRELMDRTGDESLAEEIVSVFVDDNRSRVEELGEAVETGDLERIRSGAHAIKGSSMTVGARSLSSLARRLEQNAGECDLSDAAVLFEQMKKEFERLVGFVSSPDWILRVKEQQNKDVPDLMQS